MLPIISHCVVLSGLLFFSLFSVVGARSEAGSGAGVEAFASLFASMIEASDKAFFCYSRASRVLAATILPAATRLGFF